MIAAMSAVGTKMRGGIADEVGTLPISTSPVHFTRADDYWPVG